MSARPLMASCPGEGTETFCRSFGQPGVSWARANVPAEAMGQPYGESVQF